MDLGAEHQLNPVLVGVPIEVRDDIVAVREHRCPLRVPALRQVRERTTGVEFEPVVAASPGRRDGVGFVDEKWTQSAVAQADRHGYACGACSDDRYVVPGHTRLQRSTARDYSTRPWVGSGPNLPQGVHGDKGVDLRGGDGCVAEQLLHHADVCAAVEQMSGKRVPQGVR